MKAGIADTGKISIARQRRCKHSPTVTNNHATTEELLEAAFSMRSMPRIYEEKNGGVCQSRI
jgi:hypothetical protein